MQQTIIIDAWPDPGLSEFYSKMRAHLTSQDHTAQWLWACYESGDLDSYFLALLRDHRSKLVTHSMVKGTNDVYRIHHTVTVMGRSWLRCVHGRPLGIDALIRCGTTVNIDVRFITHALSNGKGERLLTNEDVAQDPRPWQQLDHNTWQLHQSYFTDPHWRF